MNHAELKGKIVKARQPGHCFIKWWGNDEALVDFGLIDHFLEQCKTMDEIKGFELIDMEGMWRVLTELDPDPLSREEEGGREVIRWTWPDRQGKERVTTFPFTPEGVMELMENEFFD